MIEPETQPWGMRIRTNPTVQRGCSIILTSLILSAVVLFIVLIYHFPLIVLYGLILGALGLGGLYILRGIYRYILPLSQDLLGVDPRKHQGEDR